MSRRPPGQIDNRQISCMDSCIATKTISLELDAYELLRRAKKPGESFSGVVRRAHFGPCDSSGSSILKALAATPVLAADLEASAYWENDEPAERTISPSKWDTLQES